MTPHHLPPCLFGLVDRARPFAQTEIVPPCRRRQIEEALEGLLHRADAVALDRPHRIDVPGDGADIVRGAVPAVARQAIGLAVEAKKNGDAWIFRFPVRARKAVAAQRNVAAHDESAGMSAALAA